MSIGRLPGIIELAKSVGARTMWTQSGRCSDGREDPRGCWLSDADRLAATRQIQSAGLHLITQPYIADAARQLTPAQP